MKVIEVNDLRRINKTLYKNGTLFISGDNVSILINNKIRPIPLGRIDLSQYVTKKELKKELEKEVEENDKK